MWNFALGLAVALLAAVIIAFTRRTWEAWLNSAVRAILSPATTNITGDYNGEYWEEAGAIDDDTESSRRPAPSRDPDGIEKITVRQRGRHISGEIVRDVQGGTDRISKFTGECADRHITGTYKSTDPTNPERGSFCLKITNGGRALHGGYLWYNTSEGREDIDYGRYVWRRKK